MRRSSKTADKEGLKGRTKCHLASEMHKKQTRRNSSNDMEISHEFQILFRQELLKICIF